MKKPKSKDIKIAALCMLRFEQQIPLVATEAGHWNADVVGLDEKRFIEIEIKVSKSDLKGEFTSKENKHYFYRTASEEKNTTLTTWIPNYFYFLVPKELEVEALALIEEKAPRYGLYVYETTGTPPTKKGRRSRRTAKTKTLPGFIRLSRKPTRLHGNAPSSRLIDTVLKRSSSELCRLYCDWAVLHNTVKEYRDTEKVRERFYDSMRC